MIIRISEASVDDKYKTEVFEDMSSDEKEQSEDLPTILEAKDPVLIWSFTDDLKPKVCLKKCIYLCKLFMSLQLQLFVGMLDEMYG